MGLKDNRLAVTNTIISLLREELPNVEWSTFFKGFQRGKGIVGSVVSDHIDFDNDAKNQVLATGTYVITVADSENTDTVDEIADTIFDLLEDEDLDGNAIIGEIRSIHYASAPTKVDAGAVLITYEVKYYV